MDKYEKFFLDHKLKIFVSFVVLGVLIMIIGYIMFQWNLKFDSSKEIDAAKIGQLGDFIGGIVGSLWALLGVIFSIGISR